MLLPPLEVNDGPTEQGWYFTTRTGGGLNFFLKTHSTKSASNTPPNNNGAFQISCRSSRILATRCTLNAAGI